MKAVMILTLAAIYAPSAQASPVPKFMEKIIGTKVKSVMAQAPKNRLNKTDNCANLSGKWKGTCTVGSDKQEMSMNIEQEGCVKLKIDGDEMLLGQNNISVASTHDTFGGGHSTGRFSADGTSLGILVSFFGDARGLSDVISGRVAGTVWPEAGSLQVRGNASILIGALEVYSQAIECQLDPAH